MNLLTYFSIFILVTGLLIFISGLIIFWIENPAPEYATAIIMTGFLLISGSILMVTISVDYDDAVKRSLTL